MLLTLTLSFEKNLTSPRLRSNSRRYVGTSEFILIFTFAEGNKKRVCLEVVNIPTVFGYSLNKHLSIKIKFLNSIAVTVSYVALSKRAQLVNIWVAVRFG